MLDRNTWTTHVLLDPRFFQLGWLRLIGTSLSAGMPSPSDRDRRWCNNKQTDQRAGSPAGRQSRTYCVQRSEVSEDQERATQSSRSIAREKLRASADFSLGFTEV
jgi:hypothetical protein